jgi:hypothetical protein
MANAIVIAYEENGSMVIVVTAAISSTFLQTTR